MIDQRVYDLTTKESVDREVNLIVSKKEGTRIKVFVLVRSDRRKDMVSDSLNAMCFLAFALLLGAYILTGGIGVIHLVIWFVALSYVAYLIYLRWRSSSQADKRGQVVAKTFLRNGGSLDAGLEAIVIDEIKKLTLNNRSNT